MRKQQIDYILTTMLESHDNVSDLNVTVDGANPTFWDYALHEDGDNRWIYFSYQHSELEIVIVSELPSVALLLLLVTMSALMALFIKKNRFLTSSLE